jgi:hypothetical protein
VKNPSKFPYDVGDLVGYQHPGIPHDRGLILQILEPVRPVFGDERKEILTVKYRVLWLNTNKVVEWHHDNIDDKFYVISESP